MKLFKKSRNSLKYIKKNLVEISNILNSETYYPESERKTYYVRLFENILHFFKTKEANSFYNLYGLDIKKSKDDFIDYLSFKKIRNKYNLKKNQEYNYVCLLRDKFYFEKILNDLGYDTPKVIYYTNGNGLLYKNSNNQISFKNFFRESNNKNFFLKLSNGECADGVYELKISDDIIFLNENIITKNKIIDILSSKEFIIQEKIKQHKALDKLFSKSINTLRIVTVEINGEIEVLASLLRCGVENNNVDNWAKGGLAIGINSDGSLKKYGFYKPGFGTKVEVHPNSNIKFESYEIPFYKNIIEEIKKIHLNFKKIKSIGWDIAILENKISIIEGNDNWEISLHQVVDGSYKNKIKIFFNEEKK